MSPAGIKLPIIKGCTWLCRGVKVLRKYYYQRESTIFWEREGQVKRNLVSSVLMEKPISDILLPSLTFRNNLSLGIDFIGIKSVSLTLMVFKIRISSFQWVTIGFFLCMGYLHPA